MSYWRLFYHIVWATHERLPLIDNDIERLIRGVLHSKAKDLGIFIREFAMVEDHLHLVVSIPPTQSIAAVVSQLKGASSYAVNHLTNRADARFRWQDGYAVLSFGERSLASVRTYVRGQKEHHAHGTTNELFERLAASERDTRAGRRRRITSPGSDTAAR
jgi:putative transposase